ncbi:MAG: pantetheine-phosphate adenylyltransferase [Firmicutes bacterium]|nr:pantetheine-phosphate adenylyltransferase [Bacillota bacterium]
MKKLMYTGSFDPMTKGHADLIKRGAKLADELIVGIIQNVNKKTLFTIEERRELVESVTASLDNVRVVTFEGLLADYLRANEIPAVLRGLRATLDFEYEIQMAQINSKLYKGMETVFLMTDERYSYISSSAVRELYSLGGDYSDMVPEKIYEYMQNYKR